jgi:colanic acid/amylovoran biosynthesis glycosyltransferase
MKGRGRAQVAATFAAMPLRLAIATPSLDAWSETFIAAHLRRLPGQVLTFSDGIPAKRAGGELMLLPKDILGSLRALWERKVQGLDHTEQLIRRTAEQLRRHRVQAVLAEYGNMAAALVPACKAAHVPLVAHFHGYDAHRHDVAAKWNGYRELFQEAAALIVVSRAMEKRLIELGAPPGKVHYNPYGVDIGLFLPGEPAQASPHFLGVGRFVDKKAPHLTLAAFRQVAQRCPEARLTLVGDGPLREACRNLVQVWGLAAQVDLPGVKPPDWIAQAMRTARAFVQHSVTTSEGDSEGTPLAVLEAMACGLPVVATRHAGIADVVVHGESGLLSAELDVDNMAAHMIQLVQGPEQAGRMGLAGRAHVAAHHRVEDRVAAVQRILEAAAS